jgi:hypothetical protein
MKISKNTQNMTISTITIILILLFPFMFRCLKNMKFLETTEICIVSLYIILLIVIYRGCLQWFDIELYNDPLIEKLHPDLPFDKWQLSHFFVYMIAASLYPQYKYTLFGLGIIWETIEVILGQLYNNIWWYGTHVDLIANGFGILVGVYLLHPMYKYL